MKERNKEHVRLKKAIRAWAVNSNFYKFMNTELLSEKKTAENIHRLPADHYEDVRRIYSGKVEDMERRLAEMMEFSAKFEEHLAAIPLEYQQMIRKHYKNRESIDAICVDMFISRATYFRMLYKANDLLIAEMKKSGFWDELEDVA